MNMSLRTRLALIIAAVAGALAVVLAAVLHAAVAALLWRDLDREVGELARIFADLVEWDAATGFELEGDGALARALQAGPGRVHVAVRTPSGTLLDDPVLAPGFHMSSGTAFDLVAADGAALRGVRLTAALRESDGGPPPVGDIEVVVARETAALQTTLAALARWCWLSAAASALLAAAVAWAAARRGTRPVLRLARALEGVGGVDDALALRPADVPLELQGVVREVAALLERMRAAFARERRFTADVAHELRTPLALLRAAVDAALQGQRDAADLRARLRELEVVAARLSATVDSLLLLGRAGAGQLALRRAELPLYAVVEDCWAPLAAAARARGLGFADDVAPDAVVVADDTTLRMIVANLLANAVEYTAPGGQIRVWSDPAAGALLGVFDSGPPIAEEHLPRLFEPFWRADPARSDAGVHCGIGLSLAQALARCQGLDVRVENHAGGVLATIVAADEPGVAGDLAGGRAGG